jgi:lipopolysaccharide export system permease protein
MSILDRYVLKQFFPIFIAAILMFVSLIILIDLFANLFRYLNSDVSFWTMIKISLYYIPKSISFALPIGLLFATAYTLGDLYSRNELTAIFSSGIPYRRFVRPFIFLGIVISFFSFFFEDLVVIPTLKEKNFLSKSVLNQNFSQNRANVVFKTNNSQTIYSVDFYDDRTQSLNGIIIVEQTPDGKFISLLRAQKADWKNERWEFQNAIVYSWLDDILATRSYDGSIIYNEHPDVFKRNAVAIEELPIRDARIFIHSLKISGVSYTEAETDFYHRFSFPIASIVVILLSVAMGGRFRKNILLMSLLTSLGISVVFYIMEMITMMMAKLDYIPSIFGGWVPVVSFISLGIILLRGAKT